MNVSLNAQPIELVENFLLGLFQKVLTLDEIKLESDIFDLGATSSTLVQIGSDIYEYLGCEVALESLFESRTISKIASEILPLLYIGNNEIDTDSKDAEEELIEFWLDTLSSTDDSAADTQPINSIFLRLPINMGESAGLENNLDLKAIAALLQDISHAVKNAANKKSERDSIMYQLSFTRSLSGNRYTCAFPVLINLNKPTDQAIETIERKIVGGLLRSLYPFINVLAVVNDYCKSESMPVYTPMLVIEFHKSAPTVVHLENSSDDEKDFISSLENIVKKY